MVKNWQKHANVIKVWPLKPFCNYCNRCCHSMSSFEGVLFCIVYVSNFSREITKCNYVDTRLPCMTSAFAVLFLALLRATQIELVSPSFQVKPFCNYWNRWSHLMSFFGGVLFGKIYVSNFFRQIKNCNYTPYSMLVKFWWLISVFTQTMPG